MGGAGFALFKNIFENILSLTGVELGFFADSTNTYQYIPFELLKLDLCAKAVFGRKETKVALRKPDSIHDRQIPSIHDSLVR